MPGQIEKKILEDAWKAWEADQKTNKEPVNPHAFVYGYLIATKKAMRDRPEETKLLEARILDFHVMRKYQKEYYAAPYFPADVKRMLLQRAKDQEAKMDKWLSEVITEVREGKV